MTRADSTNGRLQRLHHVRVSDPDLDLSRFPDFLIIGPQRTGTTWLHANLRWHPQIFLSEPKELFYFSRLKTPDHPGFQSADLAWYLSFFREDPLRWAYKQASALVRYRSLYRPLVRGEATASYAACDRDVIEDIATINSQIRAIMMVREPVERAWSHAKKDLARNRGRKLSDVSTDEFERFFRDPYQIQCARYAENLRNWADHIGADQVLVGRFEDVSERPEGLLREVLTFLGVSADACFVPPSVREAVNPTAESAVPERHRRFLEDLLGEEIREWREHFASARPGVSARKEEHPRR